MKPASSGLLILISPLNRFMRFLLVTAVRQFPGTYLVRLHPRRGELTKRLTTIKRAPGTPSA
ncbi:hypothetical protein PXNS11_60362 [Stutzerimonas xanthomarina]|nr:hypothetical protein PXNS11_60362 [Stutzerimonas xanthomarina]